MLLPVSVEKLLCSLSVLTIFKDQGHIWYSQITTVFQICVKNAARLLKSLVNMLVVFPSEYPLVNSTVFKSALWSTLLQFPVGSTRQTRVNYDRYYVGDFVGMFLSLKFGQVQIKFVAFINMSIREIFICLGDVEMTFQKFVEISPFAISKNMFYYLYDPIKIIG